MARRSAIDLGPGQEFFDRFAEAHALGFPVGEEASLGDVAEPFAEEVLRQLLVLADGLALAALSPSLVAVVVVDPVRVAVLLDGHVLPSQFGDGYPRP
ncbi:MAG TPA: hypothetical protein VF950_02645 [Planctomycetota bacterium]